jgi:hypothetical protein
MIGKAKSSHGNNTALVVSNFIDASYRKIECVVRQCGKLTWVLKVAKATMRQAWAPSSTPVLQNTHQQAFMRHVSVNTSSSCQRHANARHVTAFVLERVFRASRVIYEI